VKFVPDSRVPLDKILKRVVDFIFSSGFRSEIVVVLAKQPLQAPPTESELYFVLISRALNLGMVGDV
jgi:hypothetical protein